MNTIKLDYSDVKFADNGKLKLLIIVGTRPEIIRLAAVINKTRKYFDVILAHTGQNYDYNLNGVFFHDLQLADPEVYMNAVGADLGETMGNIISESYKLMAAIQPDAVDPADVEMLQDLVVSAVNEALRQYEAASDATVSKITGGMKLGF